MHMKSFGIGSFEFPIPGNYEIKQGPQATELMDKSAGRTITVGTVLRPSGNDPAVAEAIEQIAGLTERSWQRFAQTEGGRVVVPFRRSDIGPALSVLSMATEFTTASGAEYYINVAATDGSEIAVVTIEGSGNAKVAHEFLLPLAEAVRFAPGDRKR